MRVVAVVNRKGGVGKTTTADNLAACLAQKGHRVLLIDLDPQGGATVQIGLGKRSLDTTIHHALLGDKTLPEVIHHTEIENVDIAPANMSLDGAKVEMDKKLSRETILKRLLKNTDGYDYSIIDCEPGLTILTLNALVACDDVVIPLQAEYNSLEGTADLMQTLKDVAEILGHKPKRHFVITMVSKTVHSRDVIGVLKKEFKNEVYETMIPRNISVAEAPGFGKPVVIYAPSSPGALAYMKLTEEFLNG
jgi:chromosome partitioning protein